MEAGARILPMMSIVERSYALTRERAPALKTPLIALSVLFALRFLFQPRMVPGQAPSGGGMVLSLIIAIVAGIATVGFIVGTHRMVLRGEDRTGTDYFRFDSATWKYIGYLILFGVVAAVGFLVLGAITAAIGAIGGILIAALVIAIYIVALRLSVFLPAVAIVDPAASLSRAWAETRGNTLRLFGGGLLVVLPAAILSGIIGMIFLSSGFVGRLIGAILAGPVQALLVLISTIFISLAYDYLSRGGAGELSTTPPAAA